MHVLVLEFVKCFQEKRQMEVGEIASVGGLFLNKYHEVGTY